jgi:hypothetical protein
MIPPGKAAPSRFAIVFEEVVAPAKGSYCHDRRSALQFDGIAATPRASRSAEAAARRTLQHAALLGAYRTALRHGGYAAGSGHTESQRALDGRRLAFANLVDLERLADAAQRQR